MSETVFVICAHSDDHILGAGGTIAKYSEEGVKVYCIILSYGELSMPWMKPEEAAKIRVNEAKEADSIVGSESIFIGMEEGNFLRDYDKFKQKLFSLVKRHKPEKIFTHSRDDPHPDHRSTNSVVLKMIDNMNLKTDVYTFAIWNPITFRANYPKIYMDIQGTFGKKLAALRRFKSQKASIFALGGGVLIRAILNGIKIKKLFGEKFYKIR